MTNESASETFTIGRDQALVLFEFLTREIDERDGKNLAAAFVSEAEFWALNYLQGALERQLMEVLADDYAAQIRAARARLTPAPEDTEFQIACAGSESEAMAGKAEA